MLFPAFESVERARGIANLGRQSQHTGTQQAKQQADTQYRTQGRACAQQGAEGASSAPTLELELRVAAYHPPLQLPGEVGRHLEWVRLLQAPSQRNQFIDFPVVLAFSYRQREAARMLPIAPDSPSGLLKSVVEAFLKRFHSPSSFCCFWKAGVGLRGFPSWRCKLWSARNCSAFTALAFFPSMCATVATSYPRMSRPTST